MFRETLLESAPSGYKKRRPWPMAMAFTVELVAATLLVVLPLLSTGVITVAAHVPTLTTLGRPNMARQNPRPGTGHGVNLRPMVIVPIALCCTHSGLGHPSPQTSDEGGGPPSIDDGGRGVPNLPFGGPSVPPVLPRPERVRRSSMSEGQLINRVEPVYPRVAMLTGTQGEVRLHAIIAKDGTIQSLNVVSGHPMLAEAAVDAVRQWRYRPYYLNGEAVEVETFITVNFKKTNE